MSKTAITGARTASKEFVAAEVTKPPRAGETGYLAVVGIVAAFLTLTVLTWERWGHVQVDCGREMYIPSALLAGKVLYRDVWYQYGPFAPYCNAALFWIFGQRLLTLYLWGLTITLSFALVLCSLSRRFMPSTGAFVVSFCFLLQAFRPNLFNFVLPYAFPATLAALFTLGMLWFLIRDIAGERGPNLLLAGFAAALAALTKQEFGLAAYFTLAAYTVSQALRSRNLRMTFAGLRAFVPGLLLVGSIYGFLLWKFTPSFMIRENLWHAYFMRTKGAFWLASNGALTYTFSVRQTVTASMWLAATFLLWAAAGFVATRWRRASMFVGAVTLLIGLEVFARRTWNWELYFPRGVYWLAGIIVVWFALRLLQTRVSVQQMMLGIVAIAAFATGARVGTKMVTWNYAIYYNPLLILMFVAALTVLLRKIGEWSGYPAASKLILAQAVVFSCILMPLYKAAPSTPLVTARGTIYTRPDLVAGYDRAVRFISEAKAAGKRVVLLPEDTALYFMTGTFAPSRWFCIPPAYMEPGKVEDDYLRDLRVAHPDYILLSNRSTVEYGLPYFGIDYNRRVLDWIQENFKVIGEIGQFSRDLHNKQFGALIFSAK